MSIMDYVDDGTIEWLIRDNGYSLARAKHGDGYRWRADVWNDSGEHHAIPATTGANESLSDIRFDLVFKRLEYDYASDPVGLPRVDALRDAVSRLMHSDDVCE